MKLKIKNYRTRDRFNFYEKTEWALPSTIFKSLKNGAGFTLIELLIVIMILAILMTIGSQSFSASQKKARDAERKSDLNQIQKALELYKQDRSPWAYPDVATWATLQDALEDGGYMKTVPDDPMATRGWASYTYTRNGGDSLRYTMYACLENESDANRDAVDLCVDPVQGVSYTLTEP